MPLDPSIALSVRPPQIDLLGNYSRLLGLKQQQQQMQQSAAASEVLNEQRQAIADARQQQTAEAERQQSAQLSAQEAIAAIKGGNAEAVLSQLRPDARMVAEKYLAERSDAKRQRDELARKDIVQSAKLVRSMGYDPTVAEVIFGLHADDYPEAGELWKQIGGDPNKLRQVIDAYATADDQAPEPFTLNPGDRRYDAQGKLIASAPEKVEQPSLQSKDALLDGKPALLSFNPKTGRYQSFDGQDVTARVKPLPPASVMYPKPDDEAPTLSDAGLVAAAITYAKTGTLPPMGMGKQGAAVRTTIINKAAEMFPDLDVAGNKAGFAADQESLKKMTAQRDAISAFEETAKANLENFIAAARKVKDTGSPLFNQPLRKFDDRVLGSPQMAAFNVARRTVIPEFAKILNNPTLAGQLSDSARHEVEQVMEGDASMAQILAAADMLVRDVNNRGKSMDDQLAAIRDRMKKSGVSSAAPKPTHRFNPATGKAEPIGAP